MKRFIEVCCGTIEDVKRARHGGASRIELCSALSVGGLTPSAGLIVAAVRVKSEMKIHVLIRPREGDFVYTGDEIGVMEADIEAAKAAGADGVVIGALTADGNIDVEVMNRLLSHCDGLSVTFHRAFDDCKDRTAALETLIALGINRVLTSGGAVSAIEGVEEIKDMVIQAQGRIVIMPGAGINDSNIAALEAQTGATEFHGTATDKGAVVMSSPLFGSNPKPTSAEIVHGMCHNI